jgi:HD-like signal output (HDOD) protein
VRGVVPDQALLAGMLHAVGKLFVLTRVSRFPSLLGSPAYAQIEARWHAQAGRTILERWDMSAEVIDAACQLDAPPRPEGPPPDLRDLLQAARQVARMSEAPTAEVLDRPPFRRLRLDARACEAAIAASAEEVASLRAALLD